MIYKYNHTLFIGNNRHCTHTLAYVRFLGQYNMLGYRTLEPLILLQIYKYSDFRTRDSYENGLLIHIFINFILF